MRRSQCHREARRLAKAYRAAMAVCQLPDGFEVIDAESLTADGLATAGGSLVAVYGPAGEPVALPDLGEPTPPVSTTLVALQRMQWGECRGFDTASGGWLTVYRSCLGYGIDRWPVPDKPTRPALSDARPGERPLAEFVEGRGYSLTAEQVEATIDNS